MYFFNDISSIYFKLQGGFDYKKSIVDAVIGIIEENNDAKDSGLSHLCEFIEDCEHTSLATRILHLLGREGPRAQNPSKYIRFIYNRVILECAEVRAGMDDYVFWKEYAKAAVQHYLKTNDQKAVTFSQVTWPDSQLAFTGLKWALEKSKTIFNVDVN